MVDKPSSKSSEQTPASGATVVDQASVGASLDNAANDAQAQAGEASGQEPVSAPAASQEISQADIDALMGASDEVAGGGTDATDASVQALEDSSAPPQPDARVDTLQAVIEEEQQSAAAANPSSASAAPAQTAASAPTRSLDLPELDSRTKLNADANRVSMLNDVKLRVKIELGRTQMLVEDVLRLGEGSVVELDKLAGDPVDVYVNDRLVARGEVLVLNDNFCVRISEVFSRDPHRVSV